ncbi:MAG: exo-beta-1,3-glucanase (GH17 family), partial [Myxococcota bacterium]
MGQVSAVAYSGFRTGQHPDRGAGSVDPSDAEMLEDLRLLTGHGFALIRLYDSRALSGRVLELIERHNLPIGVMLGAWLAAEVDNHEHCEWLTEPIAAAKLATNRVGNSAEIQRAIVLANRHPKTVIAVSVGNEALVKWNDHLVTIDALMAYARTVKAAIAQPITTADNYVVFRENGRKLSQVLDFFAVHTYPVWEGKTVDEAPAFTIENLESVRRAVPDVPIVIGEAGWPSIAEEFGERASEAHQTTYTRWLLEWAATNHVTTFLFEAFD